MAITRETHLYEILLRFNGEGYQGAHVIDLERMIEDGAVLSERELPARPITEAEVGAIIGKQAARLVEAADRARTEAQAQIAAAAQARDDALAGIASAEQARDDALADAERAAADLAAAMARNAALEAAIPTPGE